MAAKDDPATWTKAEMEAGLETAKEALRAYARRAGVFNHVQRRELSELEQQVEDINNRLRILYDAEDGYPAPDAA